MYRERYGKLRETIHRRQTLMDIVSGGVSTPKEIYKEMIKLFPNYKTCNLYLDLSTLRRESNGSQGAQGYYRTAGEGLVWDSVHPNTGKEKEKVLPCGRTDTRCYYPCRLSYLCPVEKKGKSTSQPYIRTGALYYG